MGYIVDFEMPAPPVVRPRRKVAPSRIAELTPLPRAVAEAVHEEASVWLRHELPDAWISDLAEKADTIAAHNPHFQRLLQRPGNAGRDWLWAFMRHWLSGLLHRHSRPLHARLPSSYSAGLPLPPAGREGLRLP